MTNKDKFIEVFGFEPDTETMIPVCPPRGVECPFMDDGIYSECHCELWWGREYKEPNGAHWIKQGGNRRDGYEYECSVCKKHSFTKSRFCPSCGVKMEGV